MEKKPSLVRIEIEHRYGDQFVFDGTTKYKRWAVASESGNVKISIDSKELCVAVERLPWLIASLTQIQEEIGES